MDRRRSSGFLSWRMFGLFAVVVMFVALYTWPVDTDALSGPYSINSNLREVPDVTGAQLDRYIASVSPRSPLIGLGQTWVDAGQRYGINPIYLMAHAIHETGWGTSKLARVKNNIYGWVAYDNCAYTCGKAFSTKQACVWAVVPQINTNYLSPGGAHFTRYGATLRGMNVHYATDRNWKYSIAGIMNRAARQMKTPAKPGVPGDNTRVQIQPGWGGGVSK